MIVAVALFSLAVIALAGTWIAILLRPATKHLLIDRMHGQVSDAEGNIGFSLLCSGVQRLGQIENLLSSEYDRCEVIAVLDAWQQRMLFEKLAARYRMIRVDYLPSDELPVHGVRSMWPFAPTLPSGAWCCSTAPKTQRPTTGTPRHR